MTALGELSGIPTIYTSVAVMLSITAVMVLWRRDLTFPSLLGGLVSMGVYGVICLLLDRMIPGVFTLNWHTERFLNRSVLGIPVEEILYSGAAGATATAFYPFAFFRVFIKIGERERT
jgi:hypothetical protein